MKHTKLMFGVCMLSAGLLAACAPTKSQIQDVLEKNPDIITNLIKKHPTKFINAIQQAAFNSQQKAEEQAEQQAKKQQEDEFKHPLKPTLPKDYAYWGPKNAPITIVEYSDFQCPFCDRAYFTMKKVLKAYPGKIRFLYKNFPLVNLHPYAMAAAKHYVAISLQNKAAAYKYYNYVFSHRDTFLQEGPKFLDHAARIAGANMALLKKDLNSKAVKDRIAADTAEAQKFGFTGTPGFIINGVSVRGAYPFDTFKKIIDRELAKNSGAKSKSSATN